MEMCCSCFMNTKYECLKCKIPICNQCSVFEESEEVDGWKAGSSVAYSKHPHIRTHDFGGQADRVLI